VVGDRLDTIAGDSFCRRYRALAMFAIGFESSARNAAFLKWFARNDFGASHGINEIEK